MSRCMPSSASAFAAGESHHSGDGAAVQDEPRERGQVSRHTPECAVWVRWCICVYGHVCVCVCVGGGGGGGGGVVAGCRCVGVGRGYNVRVCMCVCMGVCVRNIWLFHRLHSL